MKNISVYLGFPTAKDRVSIIRALSKPLLLGEGALLAFESGANYEMRGAFTGADLQVI